MKNLSVMAVINIGLDLTVDFSFLTQDFNHSEFKKKLSSMGTVDWIFIYLFSV